ncbi:iron-sulfur cluster assembly fusion protein SufD-SufS-SufU [Paratrimastix pyriformis]|uniref:cysteine desulfurase n=2 Tax=Paratrimastix pyriformis TaxID=342808 RepID=A0ABQ8UT33_9EUKA|nr:iron-sulfur cluster assembly fusion protein SufD-SufS-SufU [Paratrimastix pyriformis]
MASISQESFRALLRMIFEQTQVSRPPFLQSFAMTAWDRFSQLGFPVPRSEYWKNTDIAQVFEKNHISVEAIASVTDEMPALTRYLESVQHPTLPAFRLVFINGRYSSLHSVIPPMSSELKVFTLSSLAQHPEYQPVVLKYLQRAFLPDFPNKDVITPSASGKLPMVAFNAALFQDLLFVSVPAGQADLPPLHVVHYTHLPTKAASSGSNVPLISPRVLVVVGARTQCQLVEHYIAEADPQHPPPQAVRWGEIPAPRKGGPGPAKKKEEEPSLPPVYITNAVTEIYLGQGAHCRRIKMQCEDPNSIHLSNLLMYPDLELPMSALLPATAALPEQAPAAAAKLPAYPGEIEFESHTVTFGAALSREDGLLLLLGPHSNLRVEGLCLSADKHHTDTLLAVHHQAPHCTSNQVHRMVMLSDECRGFFTGAISVHRSAFPSHAGSLLFPLSDPGLWPLQHHTVADQLTNSLLVGGGLVRSTPLLQINNDDVQAKHGATVGRLDQNSIFYLQQRGLTEGEARALLTEAFALEVIRQFAGGKEVPAGSPLHPVAALAEAAIRSRLSANFAPPSPAMPEPLFNLGPAAQLNPKDAVSLVEGGFPVERVRGDFPILTQIHPTSRGALIYFDNGATTQKPRAVLEAIRNYYETSNANVHRGVHLLAERATQALYDARLKVQRFIGARHPQECIFCRGTTEAINMVTQAYARPRLGPGDVVVVSEMEHHANLVPWQLVCEERQASLYPVPINKGTGELDMAALEAALMRGNVKFVAITHASNVIGNITPGREICRLAHRYGATVLLDGAQAVPHMKVNVRELDCDFYVFSGHKMYGPTGIGVLYGKEHILMKMRPYQAGGDMIRTVSFKESTFAALPNRLEAGTPNIEGAVGLGAAIDYIESLGMDRIAAYERRLTRYALARLREIPGVRVVGYEDLVRDEARLAQVEKGSLLSIVCEGLHPHDLGTLLDSMGVALRSGHHCAMPLMGHRFHASIEDLYQDVIIDHGRHPHNFRIIEGPATDPSHLVLQADGFNSLCGDRVNIYCAVTKGKDSHTSIVDDVSFKGSGCAISQASSSLMTDLVKGKSVAEAQELFKKFHQLVTTGEQSPAAPGSEDPVDLGKLSLVFSRVCNFPSRVKCASLAWHTLMSALKGHLDPVIKAAPAPTAPLLPPSAAPVPASPVAGSPAVGGPSLIPEGAFQDAPRTVPTTSVMVQRPVAVRPQPQPQPHRAASEAHGEPAAPTNPDEVTFSTKVALVQL